MLNMNFIVLSVFLFFYSTTLFSTEANTLEIKSVTPSFIKMRHAQEIDVEIKNSNKNTAISISPGGVYVQSVLALKPEQSTIQLSNGLIWSNTSEDVLAVYAVNMKSELELMQSFELESAAKLFHVAHEKILSVEKGNKINIYSINNPQQPLVSIEESDSIISAHLGLTHACLLTDKNSIKYLSLTSNKTIVGVNITREKIASVLTTKNGCVTLSKSGEVALWSIEKKELIHKHSHYLSGTAHQILIQENMIAIANGTIGFTLLEIVENQLRWAGSYNKLGNITQIAINNNDLLVVDDKGILTLFDISHPDTPLLISDFPFKKTVTQLLLNRKKAYVLDDSKLSTISFKSKSSPMISTLGVNQGGSRRSFIKDNILYVADWFSGMHLYDITIPHAPRLLSSHHTPGSPKGVVVKDNIAFVADDDHGLQVVDVSNSLSPRFISSIPLKGLAYTMKLIDDLLYVASHTGGLHIVDVSDINNLKQIGTYDTPSKSWALEYRENFLYVADDSSGLMIFDVSKPQQPKLINQFKPGGMAEDIVIKDNKAYVAFFDNGLFILDIADPFNLKELAHLKTPGNARGIDIQKNLLYLASWEAGVLVINIENSRQPKILGQYDTSGATWGLSVKNKIIYAMDWWGGVKIIDANSTNKLRLIGKYQTAGKVEDLLYYNRFIFAAYGSRGLQVYDANNDLNPVWATGLDITGYAKQLNIHEDTAIIAASDGGLVFVDISNPFQIRWLSQMSFNETIDKITSNEKHVFALSNTGNLFVINYQNPTSPLLMSRVNGTFHALKLNHTHLFVLKNRQSFDVFNVNNLSLHKADFSFTLPTSASHFELDKNFVYVSHTDNRIAVYEFNGEALKLISSAQTKHPINDLHILEKQLLATSKHGELYVFTKSNNGHIKLTTTYQSSHQLERITTSNSGVFFSGENIIASAKLLPEVEINRVGDHFKLQIPSNMPLGTYHLTASQASSSGTLDQHKKTNAFKVGFPKLKSKFTMEDFKKKLKQGGFSGQAPK